MGKPKASKNTEFDPIEMIEKNAEVNRIDQTNPYGSSKYSLNPDGSRRFDVEFSDDLKGIHQDQLENVKRGTIKDPLAHLGEQGGGAMGNLMSSMFGKVSKRYMGTEGQSDSRHGNIGKGGEGGAPPPVPPSQASTSTQVRELQEKQKLAEQIAGSAQQAPSYPVAGRQG